MRPLISMIVPAYNEGHVIGAALAPFARSAAGRRIELIVVPNNCSDDTASTARHACPAARVIETPTPGKAHAMNLGFAAARGDAVVFLDADLTVSPAAVEALAHPVLSGETKAACGRMEVRTRGTSPLVRLFYRGWSLNPYHDNGKFGGMFALARDAAGQIFPLPSVTADDEYIARRIGEGAIAFVPEARFSVYPPHRLRDLIRIRRRSHRGTVRLAARSAQNPRPKGISASAVMLARAASRPGLWGALLVFATLTAWIRLLVALERRRGGKLTAELWERDDSSRLGRVGKTAP
ncbi:MAG: glycosyltransferase family 2 protein [Pseudomonadota bacterium]